MFLILLPFLCQTALPPAQITDDDLVCEFQARVDGYALLHRRLEIPLPPQVITDDPVRLFISKVALAAEIRRERAGARQGEIFTPTIAAYMRRVVNRTLREEKIDLLAILAEDDLLGRPMDVRVNADFPAGAPVSFMAPQLLAALPPLPPELQYRFANFDLLLWDVHAGLIVDFVPGAFRPTTRP